MSQKVGTRRFIAHLAAREAAQLGGLGADLVDAQPLEVALQPLLGELGSVARFIGRRLVVGEVEDGVLALAPRLRLALQLRVLRGEACSTIRTRGAGGKASREPQTRGWKGLPREAA